MNKIEGIPDQENQKDQKVLKKTSKVLGLSEPQNYSGVYETGLEGFDSMTVIFRKEFNDVLFILDQKTDSSRSKYNFIYKIDQNQFTTTFPFRKFLEKNPNISIDDIAAEAKQILDDILPEGELPYDIIVINQSVFESDPGDNTPKDIDTDPGNVDDDKIIYDPRRTKYLHESFPDIQRKFILDENDYSAYVASNKIIFDSDRMGNALFILPLVYEIEDVSKLTADEFLELLKKFSDPETEKMTKNLLKEHGAIKLYHPDHKLSDDEYKDVWEDRLGKALTEKKDKYGHTLEDFK